MPHHHVYNWRGALRCLLPPRSNWQWTGSLAPPREVMLLSPSLHRTLHGVTFGACWNLIYLICLTFTPPHSGIWLHGFIFRQRHVQVQVEEAEHPLHLSVVPVMPAWCWSSESSVKSWYEGAGSSRQESVNFLLRSSPVSSSSIAKVVASDLREKNMLFVMRGLRGLALSLPRWLCSLVTNVLGHLSDDEIVLTGRCLGKEIDLMNISWRRAWFKKAFLLGAAVKPLLKPHLFQ